MFQAETAIRMARNINRSENGLSDDPRRIELLQIFAIVVGSTLVENGAVAVIAASGNAGRIYLLSV